VFEFIGLLTVGGLVWYFVDGRNKSASVSNSKNYISTMLTSVFLILTALPGIAKDVPWQTPSQYPESSINCKSLDDVKSWLLNFYTNEGMVMSENTANTIAFEKTENMTYGQRFKTNLLSHNFKNNAGTSQKIKTKVHFTAIPQPEKQCRVVMHTFSIVNPGTDTEAEKDISLEPKRKEQTLDLLERMKTELSTESVK
jgi:hypothetical protein